MIVLYIITILLMVISTCVSPGKTAQALRITFRRFGKIAPAFVLMLALVSITLYLLPDHTIARMLARENKWAATAGALGLGSISIMPGFIAYPLCGILLDHGALFMVISAFSTSIMMVGVITFPLEKSYLGTRLTIVRNIVSLAIAIAVATATGLFFGELP